ncbi:MAG: HEAT repeat domain-containing protein [Candidatus Hodarchaeales archaeon]|jgi:hypothetical protein
MSDDPTDNPLILAERVPDFVSDFVGTIGNVFLVLVIWYFFFTFVYTTLYYLLDILGLIVSMIIMMYLLTFTFAKFSEFLSVMAYQSASWRTGIPYMNYKTKCPFLQRKFLNFTCIAEQIAEFDIPAFEKCHREAMWLECWPDRVPSIIDVFDNKYDKVIEVKDRTTHITTPKRQQQLAFILGAMKERAKYASFKMLEVLKDESYLMDVRLAAGYALAEMKDESGIEIILSLIGQTDTRQETTVRAVVARFGELAIPYVATALENCEDDLKCGAYAEIMGKIGTPSAIPALEKLLNAPSSEDYTLLQTIYALHEIGTKEAYEKLITFLENAQEEEKSTIKDVLMTKKLITFPILIQLLNNAEISEDYYAEIGDILAQVQAPTYDKLFTKLEDKILVSRLASILKEHTPDEEEYLPLHAVIDKHNR